MLVSWVALCDSREVMAPLFTFFSLFWGFDLRREILAFERNAFTAICVNMLPIASYF